MSKNRFAGLLDQVGIASEGRPAEIASEPIATAVPADQKMGKRRDPRYQQISTYTRKDLYLQVKRELLDEDRDFSDLLDELLHEWCEKRRKGTVA